MLSKGEKNENLSILMLLHIANAIAMSRDLQSWRSSFSLFKHIYYFQFFVFDIIRFVVWFYVVGIRIFCKFIFRYYWSFYLAEFTLLSLFPEFLISALFVIYSSPSMFAQSLLRSFSSVILLKYIHCLYTFRIRFFV